MMNFFFGMIKEVLWAMGNDIDRLAEMTPAFSVPGETVKKFAWIIKPVGKFLNRLTFKKIWRLCKKESGLKKADIADIADNKVIDFILSLSKIFTAVIRLIPLTQKSISSSAVFSI